MNKIKRKWWFAGPVSVLTVGSTFWLCWRLGFPNPLAPFSLPRLILFVIALSSFQWFYAWTIWAVLLWVAPTTVGEKRLGSQGHVVVDKLS